MLCSFWSTSIYAYERFALISYNFYLQWIYISWGKVTFSDYSSSLILHSSKVLFFFFFFILCAKCLFLFSFRVSSLCLLLWSRIVVILWKKIKKANSKFNDLMFNELNAPHWKGRCLLNWMNHIEKVSRVVFLRSKKIQNGKKEMITKREDHIQEKRWLC